jgi:hypothetical protein
MFWRCVVCGAFCEKHLLVCTFYGRNGQTTPYAQCQPFVFLTGSPASGKSLWQPLLLDRSPAMVPKGV